MTKTLFLILLFLSVPALAISPADRVYTGNQVSNTVSVINPSTNTILGEIVLGNPYPNALSPLYKGQVLVHGLGYSPLNQILAVVSIGSNAVTLIDTKTNQVLKHIYVGRSPHEATFSPNGKEVWVTVRGEDYISVISTAEQKEIKQVKVADGPGMVAFTKDGEFAYICSSFAPILDIVETKTYKSIKKIPVESPFCPNIFTSPDGKYIGMTHKDIGKVAVIDPVKQEIVKTIETGAITNHVSFANPDDKALMIVTVGGENAIKIYDINNDFNLLATIPVGVLPHGAWPSPDGKMLYVGLEYADQVQPVDLVALKALKPINIGQSPQALLYASNAVEKTNDTSNLKPLKQVLATQTFALKNTDNTSKASGKLSVRQIGLNDLVEQLFLKLNPNTEYVLGLSNTLDNPQIDYVINAFTTDDKGKYAGQSTGLVRQHDSIGHDYAAFVLIDKATNKIVMTGN